MNFNQVKHDTCKYIPIYIIKHLSYLNIKKFKIKMKETLFNFHLIKSY